MADLRSRFWIHAKGWLFVGIAGLSATLLLMESPRWRTLALLALCVWASCRFYYYCFYVIEKYVDARYRFAGLWSFARWWFAHGRGDRP